MIIDPDLSELKRQMGEIQRTARELAHLAYQDHVDIDFVYLTRDEYERKSVNTLNHVARFARRDGAIIPRNPLEFPGNDATDDPDHCDEPMERELRIAHANMYYDAMHVMLDSGTRNRVTVYNAHQALEHSHEGADLGSGARIP